MNGKVKELKTVDDLGAVTLAAGAHHGLTYTADEGASMTVTRDKGDNEANDLTVVVDGIPKVLKPGDAYTGSAKANGTFDVASIKGGDVGLSVKFGKPAKEEHAAKAGK